MKKLLAILVLGLLWCNVGFAGSKKPIYLTVTVKHVAHDKMYTFGGKYRWDHAHTIPGSVNFNSLKKCTNENSANPKGCLIYKVTTKYSDGTSSTTRQWSKNYQRYKSAGKTKIAEKPEEGGVVGTWLMRSDDSNNSYPVQFFADGNCAYEPTPNVFCKWKLNANKLFWQNKKDGKVLNTKYYVTIKGNIFSGKANRLMGDGSNEEWRVYGLKDTQEEKPEVAKKPKKKKKPKYDDDKIIIIGSGSGFFISDQGHVVSNDHVVGVCKKVKAYEEGEEVFLKILATDMVNDIGLVKGKFKNKKYLNIKTDGAELGEDIIAFGYPLSQTLSDSVKLTKGIVSSLTGLGNNISQIQIDAAIQPGNSGGPVLNMNGQVVGIASAGLSKLYMAKEANYIPENVNFAVASQTLTAFLKAHKISIGTSANRTLSAKQLAKIGEPATIQLFCMNTMAEYARLKEADKHSDVLLDLQ